MAQHGHLTREEKKKIRIERKKLRKDLRLKGITKRKEFEEIAQMLGLVYGDDYPRLLWLWWRFLRFLGRLGWKFWIGALVTFFAVLMPFAVIANQKGNFRVTMSDELMQNDFELSDTESFETPKMTLASKVLEEVNAYSVADLPDNLNTGSGSQNMDDVIIYNFWIRNNGEKAMDYDWYLVLNEATKNVDAATWIMLYDQNGMNIYAEAREDGTPEETNGYLEPPLYAQAASPQTQYRQDGEDSWSVITTPYAEKRIAAEGTVEQMQPGESRKYTVVIWVEGDDPDCTEDLIGGHAGYGMRFTSKGDEEEIHEKYGVENDEKGQSIQKSSNPVSDFFLKLADKAKKK